MRDWNEVHRCKIGGLATAHREAGDPNARKLVLIHDGAFGTTADLCWRNVIAPLSRSFHVLAPELWGWGESEKVVFLDRSPYAPRIEQIADWCKANEIHEADFVGASFGGSLIVAALSLSSNPWPVRRAISFSGTGGPLRVPAGVVALGDYDPPSIEKARKLTGLLVRSLDGFDRHIQERYENTLRPGHWECMVAPKTTNPAVDKKRDETLFWEGLKNIDVPLLLVEGQLDTLLEPGWASKIARHNPNLSARVLECGHEPNLDLPDMFVGEVVTFLG